MACRPPSPIRLRSALGGSCLALLAALPATAQERGLSYNMYGQVGLIDMPTALSAPDGQITATVGGFSGQIRGNFTFQITPRLSGTFRYSGLQGYSLPGNPLIDEDEFYYDRSFDLRYQILDEGEYVPAVAVGLQDFLGTGTFSGEYIVATKTLGDSFRVTAGLGWGRLATADSLGMPFGERPERDFGSGGEVEFDQFFRGDVAVFGGIEYAATDALTIKAEYSSDAYEQETDLGIVEVNSPFNIGLAYRPIDGVQLGAAYMHGSDIAIWGTVLLDPAMRPFGGGLDPAPVPVAVRGADPDIARSWDRATLPVATLTDRIRRGLATEGLILDGIDLSGGTARVRYTNTRYRSEAQAMGRAARVLTTLLPADFGTFVLEPSQRGIPISSNTFSRTDLEQLENTAGGAQEILDRARIGDAGGLPPLTPVPREDRFDWGVRPYLNFVIFDGPAEVVAGIEARASYEITPNLVLSGAVRYRVTPTDDNDPERDEPVLYPVRTDAADYIREGNPGIQHLTLAYYGRPARNLYSRVTVGYLESMYGGISTEVLWAPVDANYALGAEVNYVRQRDFDQLFGFQDYDVVTGHVSAYYDFQNGFHGQLDVGRYLAGDWGATVAVDREFENGWSVGAYATLTDVSFEDYGEGSFDKGIRVTIPFDWFLGTPTRTTASNSLASLTRDGGARLGVDGRLYDTVRDARLSGLEDTWGRFWR
ncbi:YjbH domain-containing protein [Wenxinia marina]|uniref:Putative lipoprotein n=1 Tax=Wenxinia marina DSM 24838 TaxID=1123501 RepID=A0A0D0PGA3_9RHOB|nr:YjbH domain-containing protein [Wenxinia marina]KIQ70381.1 putative lipoprotein [Wenxinia marina DSM 24838]GGL53634.1 hypothetical protein GCM10011392_04960 [Wenxinia marina]